MDEKDKMMQQLHRELTVARSFLTHLSVAAIASSSVLRRKNINWTKFVQWGNQGF